MLLCIGFFFGVGEGASPWLCKQTIVLFKPIAPFEFLSMLSAPTVHVVVAT